MSLREEWRGRAFSESCARPGAGGRLHNHPVLGVLDGRTAPPARALEFLLTGGREEDTGVGAEMSRAMSGGGGGGPCSYTATRALVHGGGGLRVIRSSEF